MNLATLIDIGIGAAAWAAVWQLRVGFRSMRQDQAHQGRRMDRVETHLGLPPLPREPSREAVDG